MYILYSHVRKHERVAN